MGGKNISLAFRASCHPITIVTFRSCPHAQNLKSPLCPYVLRDREQVTKPLTLGHLQSL